MLVRGCRELEGGSGLTRIPSLRSPSFVAEERRSSYSKHRAVIPTPKKQSAAAAKYLGS